MAHSEHWHTGPAGTSKKLNKQSYGSTSQHSRYPATSGNHPSRYDPPSKPQANNTLPSKHSASAHASNSSQCTYIKNPGSKRPQASSGESRKHNSPQTTSASMAVVSSEADEAATLSGGDQLVTKYKNRLREMQQQLTAIDFEG